MRICALVALLIVAAMMPSCGETFRPITTPIILPSGVPNTINTVVVIASADTVNPGIAQHINLSGDTVTSEVLLGYNPVSAYSSSVSARTTVANAGGATTSGIAASTISEYFTPIPSFNGAASISLPVNTKANAMYTYSTLPLNTTSGATYTNNSSFVYTFLNGPISVGGPNVNTVGVINSSNDFLSKQILLGANINTKPTAMVGTPNGSFLYVADSNTSSVYIIDQVDHSVFPNTIAVGSNPNSMVITTDGSYIYVMNSGSSSVSVINTTTNTVVKTILLTPSQNPVKMIYDPKLLRIYVLNHGPSGPTASAGSLSIINADPTDITPNTGFNGTIVSPDVPVDINPVDMASLPNGSFVYILTQGDATHDSKVDVLNTLNNTLLTNRITVGTADFIDTVGHSNKGTHLVPVSISVSDDSSRVAIAVKDPDFSPSAVPRNAALVGDQTLTTLQYRADGSSTWTINTSTNQPIVKIPTPFASASCVSNSLVSTGPGTTPTTCTLMTPLFVLK